MLYNYIHFQARSIVFLKDGMRRQTNPNNFDNHKEGWGGGAIFHSQNHEILFRDGGGEGRRTIPMNSSLLFVALFSNQFFT